MEASIELTQKQFKEIKQQLFLELTDQDLKKIVYSNLDECAEIISNGYKNKSFKRDGSVYDFINYHFNWCFNEKKREHLKYVAK